MKRILLKQDILDKIKKLKDLFNIKKDTTLIKILVEQAIVDVKQFEDYRKGLNNFYGKGIVDLINEKIVKELIERFKEPVLNLDTINQKIDLSKEGMSKSHSPIIITIPKNNNMANGFFNEEGTVLKFKQENNL